jgi:hypothetical protein
MFSDYFGAVRRGFDRLNRTAHSNQRQTANWRKGSASRPFALFVLTLTALALFHRLPQQVFDLPIHTAEFIRRPFLQLFPEIGRDAQQKGFAIFGSHLRV